MSLLSILNVGASGLAAQQAALQVTGNNIANAGNAGYTRETATLSPGVGSGGSGTAYLGNGVNLVSVNRQIDLNLQARITSANSDASSTSTQNNWLSQVESTFNALGSNSLSGQLTTFFNDWSSLASNPTNAGSRQVVLSDGAALASGFNQVRTGINGLQQSADSQVRTDVGTINSLATQIASLNSQINASSQGGTVAPNNLLDQRDALVSQLSGLTNVTTVTNGMSMNVYIGSQPLVSGTTARQLTTSTSTSAAGDVTTSIAFAGTPPTPAAITSGEIGGLLSAQSAAAATGAQVDTLASTLIYQVNNIHASGQGLSGLTTASSTNAVSDPNAPLSAAGLPVSPTNGSFVLSETDPTTGVTTSRLIKVNLSATSSSPTTLNSLAASISDANVTATVSGGKLVIRANGNTTIGFSQDTSGTLASLGINSFFTGSSAGSIAVSSAVSSNPSLIAAASGTGNNTAALAIAALGGQSMTALGGATLSSSYDSMISSIATATSNSSAAAASTGAVLTTLKNQQQSLSGVSLDEESANMLEQQRAYQGAAQVIYTVNQMIQSLLTVVQ
jgi:flagellar hook-associated protein 1 FlgK